jgi:hypothetical protein
VAASTLVMDNAVVISARHMIRLSNPLLPQLTAHTALCVTVDD